MTSLYEAATNGMNYDRSFAGASGGGANGSGSIGADDPFGESTLLRIKQHFWTAKQLFRSKLGKKEDEHLIASDAELDTQLTCYSHVYDTTRRLLASIEDYYHFSEEVVETEHDLALFLRSEAAGEKPHLEKVMRTTTGCMAAIAQQRRRTLTPLVQLYRDLDAFNERAVVDCQATVDATERARTEYRGSLLWIKSASEELDPSRGRQMEKYRTAQAVVRQKKEKFDALKSDTLQKVDVLKHSRMVLLTDLARNIHAAVRDFYAQSAKIFEKIAEQLAGIDSYEIDVLKILNDPVGLALKRQKESAAQNHRRATESREARQKWKTNARPTVAGKKDDKSEIELEEIEVGQIVMDIPRLQPVPAGRGAAKFNRNASASTSAELIQLDDAPSATVCGSSGASPSAPLRIESPLGIIDNERLEWEFSTESTDATTKSDDKAIAADNLLVDPSSSSHLLSLIDKGIYTSIPRLESLPLVYTAGSSTSKATDYPEEVDDLGFSSIDLGSTSATEKNVLNVGTTAAAPTLSSPSKNLSSFLADELLMALNFGVNDRNLSQQM